jgi:hypothetical protein
LPGVVNRHRKKSRQANLGIPQEGRELKIEALPGKLAIAKQYRINPIPETDQH